MSVALTRCSRHRSGRECSGPYGWWEVTVDHIVVDSRRACRRRLRHWQAGRMPGCRVDVSAVQPTLDLTFPTLELGELNIVAAPLRVHPDPLHPRRAARHR